MCQLPGVDEDRAKRYGRAFLPLIKSARETYEGMRMAEDPPQDPNHRNVIELSDTDDGEEDQYDDPDFDDWVENDGGPTEQSPFFQPEPDVEAFNARGTSPS